MERRQYCFYVVVCGLLTAFFSMDAKAALVEHGRTLLLRPYTEPPPRIENKWSFIEWEDEQTKLDHEALVLSER